ncbi:hypothetical protein [Escherichia coli]|nr:hypothetical protein [Escherichia coli]
MRFYFNSQAVDESGVTR